MPHQANSWAHVEDSAIALGAAHNLEATNLPQSL
jgi:hypothetical protein